LIKILIIIIRLIIVQQIINLLTKIKIINLLTRIKIINLIKYNHHINHYNSKELEVGQIRR
jgi:hypothetical protein